MSGPPSHTAVVCLSLSLLVAVAACGDQGPLAPAAGALETVPTFNVDEEKEEERKKAEEKEEAEKKAKCAKILITPDLELIADGGADQTLAVLDGDKTTVTLNGSGSTYNGCALSSDFRFLWTIVDNSSKDKKKKIVAKLEGEQVSIDLGAGDYTASLFVHSTHFTNMVTASDEAIIRVFEKTKPPAKDKTPPVVKSIVKGKSGNNGWYVSDVIVTWLVVDRESPVKHKCGTTVIDTDGAGQIVTCTAISFGGTTTVPVSIDRDATPPVVAWTGAEAGYDVDDTVAISCAVTDPTSGVAFTDCQDVNGPAYLFDDGTNSFSASAEDVAGNQGAGSLSFEVEATLEGLANVVNDLVPHRGTANSLTAKLRAGGAKGKGQAQNAAGVIGAFINHVEALRGKKISDEAADILVRWAGTLR